jgi:hypothetical protein
MATISGVELSLITSIGGVDITSISDIAGISTSNIPGWPTGATCTTVFYGYADGREREPSESCLVGTFPYDFDNDNGILYQAGYCGNNEQTARIGYYSDGETIYFWDGRNFSEYGTCTPAVGPVNTVAPSISPINNGILQITASRGDWTVAGTGSWVYNWYSDNTLISTENSPYYDSKGDQWIDFQPSLNVNGYNYLFTDIRLEVIGSDDTGTSTPVPSNIDYFNNPTLDTFLTNSGITDPTRIAALEYLQKSLIVGNYLYNYNTNGPILDYYPFAGENESQNKWSLYYPTEYFNFSGNWTHSSNGSQTNGGTGTSTKPYNNLGVYSGYGMMIGIYNSNPVTENSIDVSLNTIYGNWNFGIQRLVSGNNKAYWTIPPSLVNTSVDVNSSVGLFTMQHSATATFNGNYDNSINIYNGSNLITTNTGIGTYSSTQNSNFVIGGTNSTKNFQFAFNGWLNVGPDLQNIIQTYNSMLGR